MIFNETENQCLLVLRWSEPISSKCDCSLLLANQLPANVTQICARKNTVKELQGKVFLLGEMTKCYFPLPIYILKCVQGEGDLYRINYRQIN